MASIFSLFIVVLISVIVTRVATVALTLTGVSEDLARFQARSAFTGVGFTTKETERITSHPARRKIVMILMVLGNAGIASAVTALVFSFVGSSSAMQAFLRGGVLVGGLLLLWWVSVNGWLDHHLKRVIRYLLCRWTKLDVTDYLKLLHLEDNFGISEFVIPADGWLKGKTIAESGLREEGILVLNIEHDDGALVGVPAKDTAFRAGDRLIVYGEQNQLDELSNRQGGEEGDEAHDRARVKNDLREESRRQQDEENPDS